MKISLSFRDEKYWVSEFLQNLKNYITKAKKNL